MIKQVSIKEKLNKNDNYISRMRLFASSPWAFYADDYAVSNPLMMKVPSNYA